MSKECGCTETTRCLQHSPAMRRLVEEVQMELSGANPHAYNRQYNRHNRSGGGDGGQNTGGRGTLEESKENG